MINMYGLSLIQFLIGAITFFFLTVEHIYPTHLNESHKYVVLVGALVSAIFWPFVMVGLILYTVGSMAIQPLK